MNILQKIFTDHYEEIKYTLRPRQTEMENIDIKFVPFRCHSRFCPSCDNKYAMKRTTSMAFKLVNVQHRHCVFTIDENLTANINRASMSMPNRIFVIRK